MNIRQMMKKYTDDGLTRALASARVCQDIILKAIADGPLNRNVTIKGGVVMRSITSDDRRSTRDIDLDFIHYPLSDEGIRGFIRQLNVIDGLSIVVDGEIAELKHQDYHGKCINVKITDDTGFSVNSKIDIGVHKHFDIKQDEYCFDVCMSEDGASLLKNTVEQSFTEKLRSLLIFGSNSRRYKDIYDLYYLKNVVDLKILRDVIQILIFDDEGMREKDFSDILRRVTVTFSDEHYLVDVSDSRQRWMDEDINVIAGGIIDFIRSL